MRRTDSAHTWRFFRAGGFDQVRLDTAADLLAIDQLDRKLWVALACPAVGLEFDPRTLAFIDTDGDGRIRATELVAAVKWTGRVLKQADGLAAGSDRVRLDAIDADCEEGRALLAAAKQILANLGRADAAEISLADTLDTERIFAQTKFNGDGIVPAEAADDEAVRAGIADMIACMGEERDRSGKPGIGEAKAALFFEQAAAFVAWQAAAERDARRILPLGEGTGPAHSLVAELKPKVDDYFLRCRLASYDPRAADALNRERNDYAALAAQDLAASPQLFAGFPLARVEPARSLPLGDGVNPVWAARVARLRSEAVEPLLGARDALAEAEWTMIQAALAPYGEWLAAKPETAVEQLGGERLRAMLGGSLRETLRDLLKRDRALAGEANAIGDVERLCRYHRDLHRLANNFVSFRDFYSRKDKAVFQAGTLYLDQRSCDLCLRVDDTGRHAAMAAMAGTYLAYCDCVRRGSGEKMQIVAAFTAGDSDNLMTGRNGVFYDRQGRDWDATIAKIIDNPISMRQAFWAPYRKFVRMIEEQIAKRAALADAATQQKLAEAAVSVANADKTKPAAVPKKIDAGTVAAMGVALGAIGTAVSALATGLLRLPVWQLPLVFAGIVLLISGPSALIAWLKLRKRNLGPLLDANGWAVNAKAKINVPFGGALTQVAKLPAGAQRELADPFAEKQGPWLKIAAAAAVLWLLYILLNGMGFLYDWTNGRLGSPKAARVEFAAPK